MDYIYKYVWIHDTISFGYINPAESLSPHVDPSRQASQKNREDPFTLRHPAIEWRLWFNYTSFENGCCYLVLVAASAICKKEMSAFFCWFARSSSGHVNSAEVVTYGRFM